MLMPVFSINHLRQMVPIFYDVSHKVFRIRIPGCKFVVSLLWMRQLREALESRLIEGPIDIDILEWMTRTALELIGQSGLGYSFDPLTSDANHPYNEAVKNLMCV